MTQAQLIEAVLSAPAERYNAILATARGLERPQPITGRQAAELLGVCRRTLERYGRRGVLNPIRVSPRLIRFDAREVTRLAERGATGARGCTAVGGVLSGGAGAGLFRVCSAGGG